MLSEYVAVTIIPVVSIFCPSIYSVFTGCFVISIDFTSKAALWISIEYTPLLDFLSNSTFIRLLTATSPLYFPSVKFTVSISLSTLFSVIPVNFTSASATTVFGISILFVSSSFIEFATFCPFTSVVSYLISLIVKSLYSFL